ncbi:alpha/beta hydrolase [Agromyces protaetiae]|uniref:Alpha/beta hydrolase n=1 Tax=Agromyces protaetiae TaxID=2509455 RepID=A0A4P6FJT5_9MICO|nr:alpha/beta hydrolase [Agromyces protaetiae]
MFVTSPDGTRIATHTIGSATGEPALLITGGPARGVEYLGDFAGVGEVRPLQVVHPRGTPTTGGLSRGWWNDTADVIAVAEASGLEAFDLVAHSAGTRLALATVAQHPGRIRSLLLVTPPATWLTGAAYDGEELARRRAEPEVAAALASMLGEDPADEDEFQTSWRVEGPAGYAAWTAVERAHAEVGEMHLDASNAWFRDIPSDAAERVLHSELPPTLVIGGREDLLTGFRPVEAYASALGADAVFIDECGHYPWVERPVEFGGVASDWLVR